MCGLLKNKFTNSLITCRSTGNDLELEVWRTTPPIASRSSHQRHNQAQLVPETIPVPKPKQSAVHSKPEPKPRQIPNINEKPQVPPLERQPSKPQIPVSTPSQSKQQPKTSSNNSNNNVNTNIIATSQHNHVASAVPSRLQCPPVPMSILKPPPPAPSVTAATTSHVHQHLPTSNQQPQTGSSWRIRFNIEVGQGTYV